MAEDLADSIVREGHSPGGRLHEYDRERRLLEHREELAPLEIMRRRETFHSLVSLDHGSHVAARDQDPARGAIRPGHRLVHKIDVTGLRTAARAPLHLHGELIANERLTGRVDAIEELEEALTYDLGYGFSHRLSDDFPMADQL